MDGYDVTLTVIAKDKWTELPADRIRSACYECPQCGLTNYLYDHDILSDGVVVPSCVCSCGLRADLKLDGWIG